MTGLALNEFVAALNAGVEHVVLLSSSSVLTPDPEANPIALRHIAVERALDEAGLDRTFVRPGYYATNNAGWTGTNVDGIQFPNTDSATSCSALVPLVNDAQTLVTTTTLNASNRNAKIEGETNVFIADWVQ